jgi:hypothetical protein
MLLPRIPLLILLYSYTSEGDSLPNGCPLNIDPLRVARDMAAKGITLYSVGCEPAILKFKEFFAAMAYATGGQYVPLRNAKLLCSVIVGGAIEEISLERLMAEVQVQVEERRQKGVTDEAELAGYVEGMLREKGARACQLRMNDASVERASEVAVKFAKMDSISGVSQEFKEVLFQQTRVVELLV